MKNIGGLIRRFREKQRLTRANLAEGICSAKYLYLIEKGERNPSTLLLRELGLKLGVNLFRYLEYADYENPLEVHDICETLNHYHKNSDFTAAYQLSLRASELPDFKAKPLIFVIKLYKATYFFFVEKETEKCLFYCNETLAVIPEKYRDQNFTANFLLLVSLCHYKKNAPEEAESALLQAEKIAEKLKDYPHTEIILINAALNHTLIYIQKGEYKKAISTCLNILESLALNASYANTNFIFFYLSLAYYKEQSKEESALWFARCLLNLLLYKNEIAAANIFAQSEFKPLIKRMPARHELQKALKNTYPFYLS